MKKALIVLALAALAYAWLTHQGPFAGHAASGPAASPAVERATDDALARAYDQHLSNVRVEGSGVLAKVLKDDDDGSRHQRLIVRLPSGQTILIAHNIDLAPRVQSPREGEAIRFSGEYEWNDKGGVVHWTHRDPSGRHPAGWLRYDGQLYQ